MKNPILFLLVVLIQLPSFSQDNPPPPTEINASLKRSVEWLKDKLSYYEEERYRTGEIYKEYETKVSFDYQNNNLIYEVDRKGLRIDDHHKYIIPLKYIDPGNIQIAHNKCCTNCVYHYETDEATLHLFTVGNRKGIRLIIIDKDGKEYELEYKRNKVEFFIPTAVIKRHENLPEKCVKVLELLISLCEVKQ
ncbi:MAG: hypothetical protein ABII90_07185 [Bacteroidota bacterium]